MFAEPVPVPIDWSGFSSPYDGAPTVTYDGQMIAYKRGFMPHQVHTAEWNDKSQQ